MSPPLSARPTWVRPNVQRRERKAEEEGGFQHFPFPLSVSPRSPARRPADSRGGYSILTDGHAISRILCIFISVLYVARSWCMRSQPRASQGVVGIPWLWGWVTLWPSESPHIFPPPPPLAIPPSPTLLLLLLFSPRPLPNPAFFHVLAQTRRFITCTGNWRGIILSSVHCKFICSVIYRKYIPFFPHSNAHSCHPYQVLVLRLDATLSQEL